MPTVEEVKVYLHITWDEPETNQEVEAILPCADAILRKYISSKIDYEKDLMVNQLFFDLCRYIYNHASDQFKIDYHDELFSLRNFYISQDTADGESNEV